MPSGISICDLSLLDDFQDVINSPIPKLIVEMAVNDENEDACAAGMKALKYLVEDGILKLP